MPNYAYHIYEAAFDDAKGDELDLTLPVLSLVGYAGSGVCSNTIQCFERPSEPPHSFYSTVHSPGQAYPFGDVFQQGTLTPSAATPEPSSWLLLATGTLALCAGQIARMYSRPSPLESLAFS